MQVNLYLIDYYPILIKILLGMIVVLFFLNFHKIISIFKPIQKRIWLLLLIIFLLGLALRLFFIPHTHYIFYDEYDHLNIAENILYANKFCCCFAGSNENCSGCFLPQWPPAYHVFLSSVMKVFGDSEKVAFKTSAIIGSVTVVLVFLLGYLIFKNSYLALAGSFLFNLIPVHLKYSGAISPDIFFLFFTILSLILSEIYFFRKKFSIFLLFLTTLIYTIQIRPEGFMLILWFFPILWKRGFFQKINFRYLIPLFIFGLLLIPLGFYIYYGTVNFPQTPWHNSLWERIANLKHNFLPNILFFLNYKINSVILFLLSILGIAYYKKYFSSYYLSFFTVFFFTYSLYQLGYMNTPLLYHDGAVKFRSDAHRYSLILFLPLLIFAINGIDFIVQKLKPIKNNNYKLAVLLGVASLFLLSNLPAQNFVFAQRDIFKSDHEFILSFQDKISENTYVISRSPTAIISTIHKKAIEPYIFLNIPPNSEIKNNVILFKDSTWTNEGGNFGIENTLHEMENKLKEFYNFELIEKSGQAAFYRLVPK